jgi:hypothetical protein
MRMVAIAIAAASHSVRHGEIKQEEAIAMISQRGNRKMAQYRWVADAGHSWLSVPLEDIRKLGIADKISPYSYMTHTRVYLEEDRDASLILEASGLDPEDMQHSYSRHAKCRGYAPYHPSWIHDPFRVGRTVYVQVNGGKLKGRITGMQQGRYILEVEDGSRYGIPVNNPLKYCLPEA